MAIYISTNNKNKNFIAQDTELGTKYLDPKLPNTYFYTPINVSATK